MDLGAFSVSLSVKNLEASLAFYRNLGFEPIEGGLEHSFIMLKNGEHVIGLFQGMFEGNILTFNPGWDQSGQETVEFTDLRVLQTKLRERGIAVNNPVDEGSSGPASFMLEDPDGNAILVDQHR